MFAKWTCFFLLFLHRNISCVPFQNLIYVDFNCCLILVGYVRVLCKVCCPVCGVDLFISYNLHKLLLRLQKALICYCAYWSTLRLSLLKQSRIITTFLHTQTFVNYFSLLVFLYWFELLKQMCDERFCMSAVLVDTIAQFIKQSDLKRFKIDFSFIWLLALVFSD